MEEKCEINTLRSVSTSARYLDSTFGLVTKVGIFDTHIYLWYFIFLEDGQDLRGLPSSL